MRDLLTLRISYGTGEKPSLFSECLLLERIVTVRIAAA
jgi:hypothetical protein